MLVDKKNSLKAWNLRTKKVNVLVGKELWWWNMEHILMTGVHELFGKSLIACYEGDNEKQFLS